MCLLWRSPGGFSLLEILLVLAISALLMLLAVPGYQAGLQKGRRAEAIAALLEVSAQQEQHLIDRARYTADLRELGYRGREALSQSGLYAVRAQACHGGALSHCYVLTATPASGSSQAADQRCTSLSLDSAGRRSATGSSAGECW